MINPKKYVIGPGATARNTNLDDEPITLPDGTHLDEAGAEQVAQRALADVRRRNLVPGRKSLSGGNRHSPVVQFRVPEKIRDNVEKRAKSEGISVSRLARKALEEYLAS